jgi:hypothetical protein
VSEKDTEKEVLLLATGRSRKLLMLLMLMMVMMDVTMMTKQCR